jgi:hypothetical protein
VWRSSIRHLVLLSSHYRLLKRKATCEEQSFVYRTDYHLLNSRTPIELSSLSLKTQSEADPDNMADESTPIRSSCHCGAITVVVPRLPDHINHCQCTICRRYGAAWGYYHPDEVKIETKPNAVTKQYIWGDRDISFNFCDTCGCV